MIFFTPIPRKFYVLATFVCLSIGASGQTNLLVVVQQRPDSVTIYDDEKGVTLAQLSTGPMPHELCYDAISKHCLVTNFGVEDYDHRIGTPGNSISVLDPFSGTMVRKLFTRPDSVANCPHGIKMRPGRHREFFVNIEIGDSILVFDADQLKFKRGFPVPPGTHNFIFSTSGDSLYAFSGEDGVYLFNANDGTLLQHKKFSSPIRGLTFIGNDILASGKGELFVLSPANLSVLKHFDALQAGQILYSEGTEDGKYIIAPVALDNIVLIVDAQTGKVQKRLETGMAPINVATTKTFAYVTHALDDHLAKIDLNSFDFTTDIKINGGNGIVIIR